MMPRLLLGLFAGLCLLEFSEGARFENCHDSRTCVEGFDIQCLECYVNSASSTVRWTVVNETGATLHLGTCYGPNNCTSPYNSSDLEVRNDGYSSNVHFYNNSSQFSGEVTCEETRTDGAVLVDTCQIDFVRLYLGHVQPYTVSENDAFTLRSTNSPYNTSTVTWSLTTTSGQTLDLGTCTDVNTCTSLLAPAITVERPYNYQSQVTFQGIDRSMGGELFCSYTYNGLTETDNVTLDVTSPATVRNCHAEVRRENWSTILSCDISNVFSSSGLYNFRVYELYRVLNKHGVLYGVDSWVFDGRLSYRDMLTPYTNITNNKVYYRGRLTYSWPLSSVPGIYTNLKVYVYVGLSSYTPGVNVGSTLVNITTPSQPTHNCSELNYIPETGVVPCVCTADYLGSPAGRLVWLLGNVPIATGDYGVPQLTFPSGQVSRQQDGMMVTCQLDWVQPINTTFTTHVAWMEETHAFFSAD